MTLQEETATKKGQTHLIFSLRNFDPITARSLHGKRLKVVFINNMRNLTDSYSPECR